PEALAVTWKAPAAPLASSPGAVASPPASLTTVALPENEPPGPAAGAGKVTVTPWTRLPAAVRAAAARGVAEGGLMGAGWLLPAEGLRLAGASSSRMVPLAVALPRLTAAVFSSTLAVLPSRLAVTRSGKPSALTSPNATDMGMLPVAKV